MTADARPPGAGGDPRTDAGRTARTTDGRPVAEQATGASSDAVRYVGRFAPSPTGALHAGSLVAALASALDARAHGGAWRLRIEDLDPPREMPGAAGEIVRTLERLGFVPDGPIVYQSTRHAAYQAAFDALVALGRVYPCACTRREIADSITRTGRSPDRHREAVYPGTCRHGLPAGRAPRAWRLRVDDAVVHWCDRAGGEFEDVLSEEVGDFVLKRADGLWAYQLAVVVDDAAQGVTDVVRGEDLAESTSRQILLQRLLGLPTPRYLHVPVVVGDDGEKLSKQNGARAIDASRPLAALERAMRHLGLEPTGAGALDAFWDAAVRRWREALDAPGGLARRFQRSPP